MSHVSESSLWLKTTTASSSLHLGLILLPTSIASQCLPLQSNSKAPVEDALDALGILSSGGILVWQCPHLFFYLSSWQCEGQCVGLVRGRCCEHPDLLHVAHATCMLDPAPRATCSVWVQSESRGQHRGEAPRARSPTPALTQ